MIGPYAFVYLWIGHPPPRGPTPEVLVPTDTYKDRDTLLTKATLQSFVLRMSLQFKRASTHALVVYKLNSTVLCDQKRNTCYLI